MILKDIIAKCKEILEDKEQVGLDGDEWWEGYSCGQKDFAKDILALIEENT